MIDVNSTSVEPDDNHQWEIPSRFNFATDVVDHWAREPDLEALIAVDAACELRRYTYADISRRSKQVAALLTSSSLERGDRVIVMLPRTPEWIVTMVACARVGLVPIPSITMLTAPDLKYRIEHSSARGVVTTSDNAPKFDGLEASIVRICVGGARDGWIAYESAEQLTVDVIPADVGIGDPAVLYYTSGSTGGPKGVLHAAAALHAWRVSAEFWLSLDRGARIWCTADTGWSKAGTSILFGPFSRGATTVLYDGPFVPATRFELLKSLQVNVFCAAATELRQLILGPGPVDLPDLRLTVSAGESVNPEVVTRWKEMTGVEVLDGYGQTETLMTVTNRPGRSVKPGSMGRPLPGTEIAVLVADAEVGGPGAAGQLLIKAPSPQLMLGYYGDPARTEACYVTVGGQRWFQTGDNVAIDPDGDVFYLGRSDDIINSSGYRIGPQEVENALIAHAAVQECAVVGQPDPERGEIVVAFVVLAPGVEGTAELSDRLQRHVKAVTAPYKYPRRVEFVPNLPKTVSGKLLRNHLRRQLASERPTPGSSRG